MKKLIAAIVVLFSAIVPVQAGAVDQKALVIIDSYFDSKVSAPNVSCITLLNEPCTDIVLANNKPVSDVTNHGNAMAEIAKKQNPGLPIILLRGTTPNAKTAPDMNAADFIASLRWVDANSSKVGAVSFSRFFNGKVGCSPAATNTAQFGGIVVADKIIRDLIAGLKSKGIPVFAATGNKPGTRIDYPACITDTVSVSVGAVNSKGVVVPSHAYDLTTDYLGLYSVRYNVLNFKNIAQSTSTATVAVAAQWITLGNISEKVVLTKS